MFRTPFLENARPISDEASDITAAQMEANLRTYEKIVCFNGIVDFPFIRSYFNSNSYVVITEEAKQLITGLLSPLSNDRLTAREVLQSDWINHYES